MYGFGHREFLSTTVHWGPPQLLPLFLPRLLTTPMAPTAATAAPGSYGGSCFSSGAGVSGGSSLPVSIFPMDVHVVLGAERGAARAVDGVQA